MKLTAKIFIATASLILTVTPLAVSAVHAVDTTTAIPATSPAKPRLVISQQQRLTNLKARGNQEITRRLAALNVLLTRISAAKNISSSDKATLTGQIQTEIGNLTTLKAKIDADTDLPTLQADVKSIITDYRVYVFFLRKIRILAVSDRMTTAANNLTTLASKLQDYINKAQAAGKNVSTLLPLLTDMQAKIADAKTQDAAADNEVAGLDVSGWPGNKAALDDAISKLKTGAADLKTARQDARQIVLNWKALGKLGK